MIVKQPVQHIAMYDKVTIQYMHRFLRDVMFEAFAVNWLTVKFSSSKFYWQNFGLHRLESRMYLNGNVWHLKVMMVCFYLSSCSHWGSLESGHQTCHHTALFNPFCMAPIDISSMWGQFRCIKPDIRGCVAKCRLLDLILDRSS